MKLNIMNFVVGYAVFALTLSFIVQLLLGTASSFGAFPSIASYLNTSSLYSTIQKDLGGSWALSLPTLNLGAFVDAIVDGFYALAHAFSLGTISFANANYTILIPLGSLNLSIFEIPIIIILEFFALIYNLFTFLYLAITWIYSAIVYPYQFIPSPFGPFFEGLALTTIGIMFLFSFSIIGSGFANRR